MIPPRECEMCGWRPNAPFTSLRLVYTKLTREELRCMASRQTVGWCGHPSYAHWVCKPISELGGVDTSNVYCPAKESEQYISTAEFAEQHELPFVSKLN
jgi:hypothetical protein